MAKLLTIAIPLFGPFLVWGLLYATTRRNPIRVISLLTWIRVFRWVGWLAGIALGLFKLVDTHVVLSWWIVNAFFVFQLGLSLPESWLKSKHARIDEAAASDGSAAVS